MARVDYSGRMASVYAAGRSLSPETLTVWMDTAARYIVRRDGPILDLGSGTGRFSDGLAARLGLPVVALEPARGMREQARCESVEEGVVMVGGAAEAIPVQDGTFVGVWASQVVHHVDDLAACAAEIRRVLRAGAPVILRGMFADTIGHIPWGPYFPQALRITLEQFCGLEEVTAAFRGAGLHQQVHEIVWQVSAASIRHLCERIRLRADSSLELLPDDEFAAGMARLEAAARQERRPVPVREALEVVVFA